MSGYALASIIALVGWLILMSGSLASFKLGWSKLVQMALLWATIFGAVFLVARLMV